MGKKVMQVSLIKAGKGIDREYVQRVCTHLDVVKEGISGQELKLVDTLTNWAETFPMDEVESAYIKFVDRNSVEWLKGGTGGTVDQEFKGD